MWLATLTRYNLPPVAAVPAIGREPLTCSGGAFWRFAMTRGYSTTTDFQATADEEYAAGREYHRLHGNEAPNVQQASADFRRGFFTAMSQQCSHDLHLKQGRGDVWSECSKCHATFSGND